MCAWQAPGSLETWRKWRNLGEKGKFLGGDKIDPDAPSLSGFSPLRTSGSKGLSLKHQTGWKCMHKPKGKLSSSTKIRCHSALRRHLDVSSLELIQSFWMAEESFWER